MVELKALSPCAGRDPLTMGTVTLTEIAPAQLTSLAPLGDPAALAAAFEAAHGIAWPTSGQSTATGAVRAIWFGLREVMLIGTPPDAGLAEHAALVDQSDAWAVVSLSGAGATDVLARLVPIDLRDAAFPVDRTARTQLVHMNASITKRGSEDFMIMVFRSMVETLYHDLSPAMAAVASRS